MWIIEFFCSTIDLVNLFFACLIRLVHSTECLRFQDKLTCYHQYFRWILFVVCSIAHTCRATVRFVAGCLGNVLGYCVSIGTCFMFLFYWQRHKVSTSSSKLRGVSPMPVHCLWTLDSVRMRHWLPVWAPTCKLVHWLSVHCSKSLWLIVPGARASELIAVNWCKRIKERWYHY